MRRERQGQSTPLLEPAVCLRSGRVCAGPPGAGCACAGACLCLLSVPRRCSFTGGIRQLIAHQAAQNCRGSVGRQPEPQQRPPETLHRLLSVQRGDCSVRLKHVIARPKLRLHVSTRELQC